MDASNHTAASVSIYLDVDGVVNPFSPRGTTDWGGEWAIADAGILDVAFAPEAVAELNELAAHPAARFVWLTTWERLAPEFLCPAIGLNGQDWPVLSSQGWDQAPEWWKLVALQKDLAATPSERIVWLDDQLSEDYDARSWAEYQRDRVLCISPDPRKGLSRRDLAAVRSYLG
ncbi:HAD domain-containing protein [Paenarthrobacter sp. NPDC056912]|uniref:HAD domain-containing protein n=1 Tax=Paenarthrobacter sp. NPDC056912 TaxID=3345965 RepID=UPI0036703B45